MGKLDGKVAIITGAGRGIGRAAAIALAKEGAAIVVAEINGETGDSTAKEIKALGGRALAITCDVSKRKPVDATVAAAVKEFGTVDILVNSAVAATVGIPLEKVTDKDIALVFSSGFMGTFYFMQACFPYLKKHGGKIINFGSTAGVEGSAGFTAYGSAKEAIRALTRVGARDWGKYMINVNAVCPASLTPGMLEFQSEFPEKFKAIERSIPLGRLGDPEKDIAPVITFLAGPDSDYVTGMTIMVDGGQYTLR